ncbi:1,4-alpha-glucan branching enzyme [Streptomyces sp. H10-C2]|nr:MULTISPECIES: 1,4-alpha-glucan branching enzyme [unclassified Streptomyces]MDJ0341461.1 1,4-alpha-glucan branching enzyme [Streptomyces sp. PH10-H1]MDJ0369118.1 1,4-alpha-glucan branching enzyme [Streptomyces sp. H10-C2]
MIERQPSSFTPGAPAAVPATFLPPAEKATDELPTPPPAPVEPAVQKHGSAPVSPPVSAPASAPAPAPAAVPAAVPAPVPAVVPAVSEAAARGYESGVDRPPASGSAPRQTADSVPQSRGESRGGAATESGKPAEAAAPVTSAADDAAPMPAAGRGVRSADPLDDEDRRRLLHGSHHDPHGLLGAHPVAGGVRFRVLRPYALGVAVAAKGLRAELLDEGDGLFGGVLPLRGIPEYELLVRYEDGELPVQDPYRFLPSLGELDLHLIGEGRHEQLWQALGARPMTHQGVTGTRFAVWAPNARGVRVAGGFNFWDGAGFPMRSLGATGIWELFVPGVGDGTAYKFEITHPDGTRRLKADPMARATELPPATASVVTSSHHTWGDQEWMQRRAAIPVHQAPFSVYEVHLTSWRPGLSYRELAEQLPTYVADLGFTHVELMPVAEHPFGGSWGYQVTSYYAPTSRLGTPDDFKHLIDALHRAGLGVIMDWVPAHFPKDDWALARFDGPPLYEHGDPSRAEHPDWGTLEFDLGRTEVRNFMVANAVYWCEEFHIDGLRVDAVASMLYLDYSREHGEWTPNEHGGRENLDAVAFLQEMNATVYRRCPGVVTIAEESTAWEGVTRSTDSGGLGFGLKWNMGWMHDSLEYVAKEPVHRKYHHHEMTFSMVYAYSENYVLPISHDEVVHGKRSLVSKMPGDWWQQRATHRAYLGFMWAHPGKQLLFMGQEFAQGAEWSHDHGPDWWLLDETYAAAADHRGVRDLVRDLNHTYSATPALWQSDTDPGGFAWIDGGAAEDNTFSFLRFDADGEPLVCVSNFSPVVRENYRIGVPDHAWQEVLNTDDARYGGSGTATGSTEHPLKAEPAAWHGQEQSIKLTLPPLATVWLRPA